ncbi:MAG: M14 family metallopeptidase [Candidatus Aminicenantes bacterium]|nr:M14 family metallopeptidase [Candidatus Aminicenantes bacterium]
MTRRSMSRKILLIWAIIVMLVWTAWAERIPTFKEMFGFNIGDDYHLASYKQLVTYWRRLEQVSERIKLVEIGQTAEGRKMIMAIITSPDNMKRLSRYKEISRRLALAEGLNDQQALQLAREGKAVVWIDGGLHATEVAGAQQLIELVYQMVSYNDPETLRILDKVILLAVPVNPDGMDLVAEWYMRNPEPAKRSMSGLPRLYQKYIGHDNNRDFYMVTQPETEAICYQLYHEWFPQIVYNHHQTGPAGTVLFCAPFRDPFNYHFDPLVVMGTELVGIAMHNRFIAEGKPGATMRSGASYSTWWNGGLRSTAYFHNMIGILTEIIGNPTPIEIPFILQRHLPKGDYPYPIAPQKWHFKQTIEYLITANRAILDLAAKLKEDFLFNIYRMGRNSIERGSRDHWTITPKKIALVEEIINKELPKTQTQAPTATPTSDLPPEFTARISASRGLPIKYYELLKNPEWRDPRGYIIPADQPDFLTATKFINALIKNGITVYRATKEFQVAGKTYPAGSYIVKCAQAFRPHILSMFEPQDHPHDVAYPGGPPIPPYDNAGWTLAYQMGVTFDRILDSFDGPFEKINGLAKPPAGRIIGPTEAKIFAFDHRVNDAVIAVNRLLATNHEIYIYKDSLILDSQVLPRGAFCVLAKAGTKAELEKIAKEIGLNFYGLESLPKGEYLKVHPVKIGLWDIYGGSMTSGWTRWLLEQFSFPFEIVYPPTLDQGNLKAKFDVLIFPSGAIPAAGRTGGQEFRPMAAPSLDQIPPEYRDRIGRITVDKTIPQLAAFLKEGGTIITIGSSTSLAYHLRLPITDALVEKLPDGVETRLPREKFYIPGSILQVKVNNLHPLAYGLPELVDVFFDNSPSFRLLPEAQLKNVVPIAWFDSPTPLRSGWALGQGYLQGSVAAIEALVDKGKLYLFGPEILFRGQPHGTFKLFFNAIFLGGCSLINF